MNHLQIKDIIATALSCPPSLLGSYILPDGSAIPAIYTTGSQGVPSDWRIMGLEAVIEEFPIRAPRAGVGTVISRKAWRVTLVNYDGSTGNLDKAVERLERRFPDASFSPSPKTDIAYAQYVITIPDTETKPPLRE